MSEFRVPLVAVVCVIGLLTVPVAGAGFGDLAQEQVDPDTVVMTVDLQADGDAQWAVSYRTRLDDDNTTAAFESLQSDIRANTSTYTDEFGARMNRTLRTAENATGREMTLRNLAVTAETETLPQEYGVVTYRFEWTNFAAVDGDQLRAGDAVAGLFLDEESTLRMSWPEGYERTSVTPASDRSDDTSVAWDGRLEFGPEEPNLVLTESGAGSGTATTAGPQTPDGDGNAWILLVATVLAAGGVVALLWANRRYGFAGGTATTADESEGGSGDGAAVASEHTDDGDESGDSDGNADGGSDGNADGDETPPPELLSNEEQVLRLLDEHGGRVKQQQIAEQLDWTAAKTSQVIGGLRDEERLETFRIGRENVVTLPGVDITGNVGADDEDDTEGEGDDSSDRQS